jgi:alkane 1-monooxygenase
MWYDLIPLVFLSALLASMSFLIAHELIHKDNSTDKFFGKTLINIGTIHQIKNFYMHFTIEHLYGHHKKVATPEDPASAPKGMSLYRFLPKTVIGSLKSALQINPGFTLLSLIGSTLFFSSVYWKNGMLSLVFALIGGLGGVLVLEIINC